jgi:uncharacterized membrane protein YozB (DUF420 family)
VNCLLIYTYEGMYIVCLFCHVEISQIILPLAMFLISLESSQLVRVHQDGFIMF